MSSSARKDARERQGQVPQSLQTYLSDWAGRDATRQAVARTIACLGRACGTFAGELSRGPAAWLHESPAHRSGELLVAELEQAPVAFIFSRLLQAPLATAQTTGELTVSLVPLDSIENIAVNAPAGTIFSVRKRRPDPAADEHNGWSHFLETGDRQLAAGYVIYGAQTLLVLTVGTGTHLFTFTPAAGEYTMTDGPVEIPKGSEGVAIDMANSRHWQDGLQAYVTDCLSGADGPLASNYRMRWVTSLVAECHRILRRGGVFLEPGDTRDGHARGRLCLTCEANPIAMLVEQAGGAATDGARRILDITPTGLEERVPLMFGSPREVTIIARYASATHWLGARSPLFAERGLYRR